MRHEITVIYDESQPNKVMIGKSDGAGDPWVDLAVLLEGVGLLANVCKQSGITEHKGKPLNEYLKSYIDSVCGDYKTTMSLMQ